MALVTATEYKAWSGLPDSYDTLIGTLIGTATAELYTRLGVDSLESATYTDKAATGDGSPALRVRNWPITSVGSISYRGAGTDTTAVSATTYRFDPDRAVILSLYGAWACDVEGNYLVTYTAGYATVPDSVKLVMYRLIDWHMKTRMRDIFTVASQGDGSSNWASRAASDTMMLIDAEIGRLKPEVYV